MNKIQTKKEQYGMVIDLDRCTGCGSCMVACAVENNIAPAPAEATDKTGVTWMRVYKVSNGLPFPHNKAAFVPVTCQQCGEHTPCATVCPQNAVEIDPDTGIVGQIPERCLGCRYCMAACPYHARYFNWWDPTWPVGMEKTLNPDVSPRMRGVVEKCNFCHSRLHEAKARGAAEGRRELKDGEYAPACMEACPTGAITFGDLKDERTEVAEMVRTGEAFQLLGHLKTGSKVYYRSRQGWVRRMAEASFAKQPGKELIHG